MDLGDISDCSIDEMIDDEELISATVECIQTGKLTPLLKKELKCRILTKCFEEGKDLTVEEQSPKTVPPLKRELMPYEVERQERRREQNRRAAKTFRQKKRYENKELCKIISDLEEKNKSLREEMKRLVTEINRLRGCLSSHFCNVDVRCAIPCEMSDLT